MNAKYWLCEAIYRFLVVVSVLAQETNAPITWRIRLSIARVAIIHKQIDYMIADQRKHLNR